MKRKSAPGTVAGTVSEMRRGTWWASARRRSSRRKSAWNLLLLLVFPVWCFLWGLAIAAGYALHLVLHAEPMARWAQWPHVFDKPTTGAMALLTLAPMIPTLTGAMVICNFFVWQIPGARRAMNAETQKHPGTDYGTAQRALGQITLYTAPFAILLIVAGAWFLA